jgi:methionine sulfoxide reductase heme-binding subunit
VGRSTRGEDAVHLTSSPVDWYAARAAGIAAYVVLTVVVAFGLALAGKARSSAWPRFAVEDVHRFGGLLVGFFVGLHVLTIAIDSYLPFSPVQLLVPLTSTYRPLWTGLGIAAAELLVALALTNRYRRRIPHRLWRRAHYLNFAVWAGATLHGLGGGTDRHAPWLVLLYAASAASVVGLVLWRALRPRARVLIGGAAAAVGVVAAVAAVPTAQVHRRPVNAARFHEELTGQILADRGVRQQVISMTGNGTGRQNVLVRADLLDGVDRLEATSLQLEYLPTGVVCRGRVTHVESFGFAGTCRTPAGARRAIRAQWRLVDGASLRGFVDSRPLAA